MRMLGNFLVMFLVSACQKYNLQFFVFNLLFCNFDVGIIGSVVVLGLDILASTLVKLSLFATVQAFLCFVGYPLFAAGKDSINPFSLEAFYFCFWISLLVLFD